MGCQILKDQPNKVVINLALTKGLSFKIDSWNVTSMLALVAGPDIPNPRAIR